MHQGESELHVTCPCQQKEDLAHPCINEENNNNNTKNKKINLKFVFLILTVLQQIFLCWFINWTFNVVLKIEIDPTKLPSKVHQENIQPVGQTWFYSFRKEL